MLPLLVLLAMGLPTNIAGAPREGVTAWGFSVAGLSAAQGVVTAVVYGVMVLVANLTGAIVLGAAWLHRGTRGADRTDTPPSLTPLSADLEGTEGG